jgi:hypothetical protein
MGTELGSVAQGDLMEEQRFIRFELPDETGKKVAIKLFVHQIRDLISGLLSAGAAFPEPPALTQEIPADPEPVKATAIGISPLSEGDARLSISSGPIHLQFSVSLDALMQALEALKQQTEPGPTSPRRPN